MKMALHELEGIVTGPYFSDILLLEGWGPHAARLSKACVDGNVVQRKVWMCVWMYVYVIF